MIRAKLLIIIVLMSVFSILEGQVNDTLLKKIDFNDTTLVDSDFLKTTLAEYVDSAKNPQLTGENQMYNYILAVDEVLKKCTSYPMYKFVYQYFIYGFSELGANMVVDYMMRVPYLENVGANSGQRNEIIALAASFEKIKIGHKAPDIHAVTIDGREFDLNSVENRYVIILFWSYTCPHCCSLLEELSGFVKENKDFAVVTVSVSKELKKVKKTLKKARITQCYNVCDGEGWKSPIIENYAVDMTPSMFLLDKDRNIIAKPFDTEEIMNSIEL